MAELPRILFGRERGNVRYARLGLIKWLKYSPRKTPNQPPTKQTLWESDPDQPGIMRIYPSHQKDFMGICPSQPRPRSRNYENSPPPPPIGTRHYGNLPPSLLLPPITHYGNLPFPQADIVGIYSPLPLTTNQTLCVSVPPSLSHPIPTDQILWDSAPPLQPNRRDVACGSV